MARDDKNRLYFEGGIISGQPLPYLRTKIDKRPSGVILPEQRIAECHLRLEPLLPKDAIPDDQCILKNLTRLPKSITEA